MNIEALARLHQAHIAQATWVRGYPTYVTRLPCQSSKGEVVTKFRGNPWAVLLVVSLGFFMTLLDLTIVNIAIPDMIARLHASLDDVLWVINAYTLVLAALLVTVGRLGDLIGQRVLFVTGVAWFTAASAACGLAPGPGWLIAFRAVQGLGAAVLIPQTLAILTMVFPPERRGAALGVWSAVGGVATIAGPTLGGLLVTAFGWRSIFFVNLPIGVAVIAPAAAALPPLHPRRPRPRGCRGGPRPGPPPPASRWPARPCSASATAWSKASATTGARSGPSSASRW